MLAYLSDPGGSRSSRRPVRPRGIPTLAETFPATRYSDPRGDLSSHAGFRPSRRPVRARGFPTLVKNRGSEICSGRPAGFRPSRKPVRPRGIPTLAENWESENRVRGLGQADLVAAQIFPSPTKYRWGQTYSRPSRGMAGPGGCASRKDGQPAAAISISFSF